MRVHDPSRHSGRLNLAATYSETIRLAFVVIVLFVAACVGLWFRDYRRSGSGARPVALSEEARSALRHANELSLQKVREERRNAKKLAREARRPDFQQPP